MNNKPPIPRKRLIIARPSIHQRKRLRDKELTRRQTLLAVHQRKLVRERPVVAVGHRPERPVDRLVVARPRREANVGQRAAAEGLAGEGAVRLEGHLVGGDVEGDSVGEGGLDGVCGGGGRGES